MNRINLFLIFALLFSCQKEKISWNKVKVVPKLTETTITSIAATSVIFESKTLTNGDQDITEYGFCYSEEDSLHFVNKVTCTPVDWKMKMQILNLKQGTNYYVKAYAVNASGIGYGGISSFQTKFLPVVITDTVNIVSPNRVTFSGSVIFDGGTPIIESGICWSSVYQMPSIAAGKIEICGGSLGTFNTTSQVLTSNIQYYYRAYAKSKNGVAYGVVKSIKL